MGCVRHNILLQEVLVTSQGSCLRHPPTWLTQVKINSNVQEFTSVLKLPSHAVFHDFHVIKFVNNIYAKFYLQECMPESICDILKVN